jgi:hypothetical protein
MRLHCEFEAFASVLRSCLSRKINPEYSSRLRDYLHKTSKRILKRQYEGLPQAGLLAKMARARAEVSPDMIASIEAAFGDVRPSLARLVSEAASVAELPYRNDDESSLYLNIINTDGGRIIMGDHNIEVGEGAQVRGAMGHKIKIHNSSFGDDGQSTGELEDLLDQLIGQLEELGPELGSRGMDHLELAHMAELEAKSEEPAPSKIRALVSSILVGIRMVGEAAAPAIKTAEAIQELVQ